VKQIVIIATAALLLAGCVHHPLPPINAIGVDRIAQVEGELKRQLSVYQSSVNVERSTNGPAEYQCGNGSIDFDIASVQLNLTTTLESKDSGSLGATIPISIGSIGPSGNTSHDVSDLETLTFSLYPVHDRAFRVEPGDLTKPAPISDVLIALRKALLQNAKEKRICVFDYDYTADSPAKDAGGSYAIGVTIVDDNSVGVTLKLAIINVSATHEQKATTGNSLVVKFRQTNIPTKVIIDANGIPNTGVGQSGGPDTHPKH
jgi:hypothetical protein